MNDQENKMSMKEETLAEKERRALPFFVEFVKFSSVFAVIIAVALVTLQVASASI